MIKQTNIVHIQSCLNRYREWDGQALKVLCGHVDATIHGRYFGDKLGTAAKTVLRDLALNYVAEEMMLIRNDLKAFGFVFDDGCLDSGDLVRFLHEVHGEAISLLPRAKDM